MADESVRPFGPPVIGNRVNAPAGEMRPSRPSVPADAVNHSAPSGPLVRHRGLAAGAVKEVSAPPVVRRQIRPSWSSLAHRAPSGPERIAPSLGMVGLVVPAGSGNSDRAPAVVR